MSRVKTAQDDIMRMFPAAWIYMAKRTLATVQGADARRNKWHRICTLGTRR